MTNRIGPRLAQLIAISVFVAAACFAEDSPKSIDGIMGIAAEDSSSITVLYFPVNPDIGEVYVSGHAIATVKWAEAGKEVGDRDVTIGTVDLSPRGGSTIGNQSFLAIPGQGMTYIESMVTKRLFFVGQCVQFLPEGIYEREPGLVPHIERMTARILQGSGSAIKTVAIYIPVYYDIDQAKAKIVEWKLKRAQAEGELNTEDADAHQDEQRDESRKE